MAIEFALARLPLDQLHHLAQVINDGEPRPGFAWIISMLSWEATKRNDEDAGPFPPHDMTGDELRAAVSALWDFSARLRADSAGIRLTPIADVLDAAVAMLTAEMRTLVTGEDQ